MKNTNSFYLLIIAILLFSCNKESDEPVIIPEEPEEYLLVWSDEFNAQTINSANWNFELGDGTNYGLPVGWGNNEKQIYTDNQENASILTIDGESVLAITAIKTGEGEYTSAKLTTQNKVSMRFGKLEIRAKFPEGKGIWPALWMMGDNKTEIDWPGCGEIDIAEILGHEPLILYSTVHYTNGNQEKGEEQGKHIMANGSFIDEFNVFTLEWSPESIQYKINDVLHHETSIENDMKEFLRSFYIILNVAVGGNWPGDPDETTIFPQSLYVDYIRMYKKNDMEIPDAPVLDIEEETMGQFIPPNMEYHAFNSDFDLFDSVSVIVYGGGGEPEIYLSDIAVDGDSSLVFNFPGGSWGGAYFELKEHHDLSSYSTLNFSLHYPPALTNAEIKLESTSTNFSVFLESYTGVPVNEGFIEYSIPLTDFEGLDLSDIKIPFAIWNPLDANGDFVVAEILIDNIYFE